MADRLFTRDELALDPLDLATVLLGSVLECDGPDGTVAAKLTEVEAYRGEDDPASHCYRGRTPRNQVMWGPAGHLYVYFVYGMHFCANVVGREDGEPGAVLVRAAEVVEGVELARRRRKAARRDDQLAQGPARLTSALGIGPQHNGVDLTDTGSPVRLRYAEPAAAIRTGPRVGVAAAMDLPWRFWADGAPSVSAYRRGGKVRARPPKVS